MGAKRLYSFSVLPIDQFMMGEEGFWPTDSKHDHIRRKITFAAAPDSSIPANRAALIKSKFICPITKPVSI